MLDEAVLRQSTAPVTPDEREPGDKSAKSEQPDEPDQQDDRHAEISPIVRPNETELRTATPELPLGLNIRPAATGLSGLSDPATNLVFSGNVTRSGVTLP